MHIVPDEKINYSLTQLHNNMKHTLSEITADIEHLASAKDKQSVLMYLSGIEMLSKEFLQYSAAIKNNLKDFK